MVGPFWYNLWLKIGVHVLKEEVASVYRGELVVCAVRMKPTCLEGTPALLPGLDLERSLNV